MHYTVTTLKRSDWNLRAQQHATLCELFAENLQSQLLRDQFSRLAGMFRDIVENDAQFSTTAAWAGRLLLNAIEDGEPVVAKITVDPGITQQLGENPISDEMALEMLWICSANEAQRVNPRDVPPNVNCAREYRPEPAGGGEEDTRDGEQKVTDEETEPTEDTSEAYRVAVALAGEHCPTITQIASNNELCLDRKMKRISVIDTVATAWPSQTWAGLLGVTDGRIRQLDTWKKWREDDKKD